MEKKNINLENNNFLRLALEIISKLSNEGLIAVQENINDLLKARREGSEVEVSFEDKYLKGNSDSIDQFYADINMNSFSKTELINIGDRITRSKNGNNLSQAELDNRVAKYLSDKRGE